MITEQYIDWYALILSLIAAFLGFGGGIYLFMKQYQRHQKQSKNNEYLKRYQSYFRKSFIALQKGDLDSFEKERNEWEEFKANFKS